MKLSKRTLKKKKNFSTINQSILIKPGNMLETISNVKDVYAKASIDEEFDKEFAIYDMNEFLGVVSLFEDPEFLGYLSNAEKRIYFYKELMKKYSYSMNEISNYLERTTSKNEDKHFTPQSD